MALTRSFECNWKPCRWNPEEDRIEPNDTIAVIYRPCIGPLLLFNLLIEVFTENIKSFMNENLTDQVFDD